MDVILRSISEYLIWIFKRGYRLTDSAVYFNDIRQGCVRISNSNLSLLISRDAFLGPPYVSIKSQYWRHDLDLIKFMRYFDYEKEQTTRLDASTGEFLRAHLEQIEALVATKELATEFGNELSRRFPTII